MADKRFIKNIIKKNKNVKWIVIVLLAFPIVVGGIYALPLPQVIAVEPGDLLSYYGTAFGILGSFIIYRLEVNKQRKEKLKELRPSFVVSVEKDDSGKFTVNIINHSQSRLFYLYYYDEFVSPEIKEKYSFTTAYNCIKSKEEELKTDYNITMDKGIIDEDGYPKYVNLICDDCEGNTWNCCYNKVRDCNNVIYYPEAPEIV